MTGNNNKRTRGLTIKSPEDVKRVARWVISDIFQEDSQIENAGKINQLLQTWLRAYEIDKLADIEARLRALEDERRGA
ncbi:MAG: hypothetical protein PHX71_09910 [Synergistales bacterium]|nr:hypothetical protein [Synergistales bacterium]